MRWLYSLSSRPRGVCAGSYSRRFFSCSISCCVIPHPVQLEFVGLLLQRKEKKRLSNNWHRSLAACCGSALHALCVETFVVTSGSLRWNSKLLQVSAGRMAVAYVLCAQVHLSLHRGLSLIETYCLYPASSPGGACPLGQLSELRKS